MESASAEALERRRARRSSTGGRADEPVAAVRPRGHRLRGRAGRARRARRSVGLRQDDDDLPDPAPVRRGRRARSRSTGVDVRQITLESLGRRHRVRDPGDVPVPRVDPRQPAVRQARRDRGRARGGRPRRRDPRPDHRAARRLRHGRRRARLQAVRRREAAGRDRAGAAQGPADPDPRRGDVVARHRQRAADPGGAGAADRGPDDDRDRPPPVDDPARRPDPRVSSAAGSSSAARTPSCSPGAASTRACTAEQFEAEAANLAELA